jgi:3-oxoacyl-[acyl-carrier protein] reductase
MRPGHVSVIVGGSRGIGRAVAHELAARGGNTVVIARDRGRIDAALAALPPPAQGHHVGRALDISSPDDMDEMARLCRREFGRVDLLVVSAVVAGYEEHSGLLPPQVRDMPLSVWQRALDVNLHGAFLANRAVLPLMIAQGSGDILNIGSALSPHGMKGQPHAAAYSATKYALAGFTHALAAEVVDLGVRVNIVFPGAVLTPLIEGTAIAAPFGGHISAQQAAQAIVRLLQFSADCQPLDPHILPMPGGGASISAYGERHGA